MNYIIILFMIMMSFIFAIVSSFANKTNTKQIFMLGSAILFIVTGVLILGQGIEIPIGTVTEVIR